MCQRGPPRCRPFCGGEGAWLLSQLSCFLEVSREMRCAEPCPLGEEQRPGKVYPIPKPGKSVEAGGKWRLARGSCPHTSANGILLVSIHTLNPARRP